jgi:hypothetical protein
VAVDDGVARTVASIAAMIGAPLPTPAVEAT